MNNCFETNFMKSPFPIKKMDIKNITIDKAEAFKMKDMKHVLIKDDEGFFCDFEIKEFQDNGNGSYTITLKDVERSDKTIIIKD